MIKVIITYCPKCNNKNCVSILRGNLCFNCQSKMDIRLPYIWQFDKIPIYLDINEIYVDCTSLFL